MLHCEQPMRHRNESERRNGHWRHRHRCHDTRCHGTDVGLYSHSNGHRGRARCRYGHLGAWNSERRRHYGWHDRRNQHRRDLHGQCRRNRQLCRHHHRLKRVPRGLLHCCGERVRIVESLASRCLRAHGRYDGRFHRMPQRQLLPVRVKLVVESLPRGRLQPRYRSVSLFSRNSSMSPRELP